MQSHKGTCTHSLSEYLACISVCCLLSVVKAAGVLPWQWRNSSQNGSESDGYYHYIPLLTAVTQATSSMDATRKGFQKPSSQTRVQDPSHPPTPGRNAARYQQNGGYVDMTYSIYKVYHITTLTDTIRVFFVQLTLGSTPCGHLSISICSNHTKRT